MSWFFAGIAVIAAGGIGAAGAGRKARLAAAFGTGGLLGGALLIGTALVFSPGAGGGAAGSAVTGGAGTGAFFRYAESPLFGSLAVGMDPLSGLFLIPVLFLSVLCGFYGIGYLGGHGRERNMGMQWFWYDLLVLGMIGVLSARDFITLAVCWEIMTISSYFLVAFESENPQVRRAGMIYLIASHCSIALLLPGFILLSRFCDGLLFPAGPLKAAAAGGSTVFILTFCGFGLKAGFFPVHVWLPEAHPAAPSHVSALLSGAMINMGVYGILRVCSFFTEIPLWWGGAVILVGAVSAVLGILYSLGQRDLKRILAYSSVENMGIIAIGIGIGLIGFGMGNAAVGVLGISGALLHILNHCLFKGTLFLGAGSVFHSTGVRDIERLGGLAKSMKRTAAVMIVAGAAICALPPFGGFVSEVLLYLGVFKGILSGELTETVLLAVGGSLLALTGGLALLSFSRLIGIAFLGQPRDPGISHAHESGKLMTVPMLILMAAAALTGVGAPLLIRIVTPAAGTVVRGLSAAPAIVSAAAGRGAGGGAASAGSPGVSLAAAASAVAAEVSGLVTTVAFALIGFIAIIAVIIIFRRLCLIGKDVRTGATWGCGYLFPTPRIQYTGASFAHPVLRLFRSLALFKETIVRPGGFFPAQGSYHAEHPDPSARLIFLPLFGRAKRFFGRLMVVQHGRVHVYVLYVVLTLIILLLWNLR